MSILFSLILSNILLSDPIFVDVSRDAGLNFEHFNGMTGEFLLPEIMGAGGALLDYDNDGDLDLYLIQGDAYPEHQTKPLYKPQGGEASDRLYRLDLKDGKPHYVDVTKAAGIPSGGFGMGAAAGDYDGDGFTDLFIANLGSNRLLRNKGDGRFEDVTNSAGLKADDLATSAAFVDINRDGHLDLFYTTYVYFQAAKSPKCYAANSALDYCGPDAYTASPDRLFLNDGKGGFKDISISLKADPAAGLGVALLDADQDGWIDIYVANDGDPNHLWRNVEGKGLEEVALFSGLALNGEGVPEAGMGVMAADYDDDGDEDIFLTHLETETNTLYVNDGGFFDDGTANAKLSIDSMPFTGFGTGFMDLENDGDLDIVALNGAVRTILEQANKKDPYPLKQRNQLYRNKGKGRFEEIGMQAGPAFKEVAVSRAAIFGDIDNDGDTDLVVTNNFGRVQLLMNRAADGHNWLGVQVKPRQGKAQHALGSLVKLKTSDGRIMTRRIARDGSYLASNDPRVRFGLGKAKAIESLEIIWPDGHRRVIKALALNRYLSVEGDSN